MKQCYKKLQKTIQRLDLIKLHILGLFKLHTHTHTVLLVWTVIYLSTHTHTIKELLLKCDAFFLSILSCVNRPNFWLSHYSECDYYPSPSHYYIISVKMKAHHHIFFRKTSTCPFWGSINVGTRWFIFLFAQFNGKVVFWPRTNRVFFASLPHTCRLCVCVCVHALYMWSTEWPFCHIHTKHLVRIWEAKSKKNLEKLKLYWHWNRSKEIENRRYNQINVLEKGSTRDLSN